MTFSFRNLSCDFTSNAVVKGDCKISFQNKAKGQGLGLVFSLLLIQFLENDTQRSARKILFVFLKAKLKLGLDKTISFCYFIKSLSEDL